MNWFLNLSTRTKLFCGFGVMIIAIAVVIIIAQTGMSDSLNSQKTIYEKDFTIVENLLEMRSDQNRARALILEMMFETNRTKQELLWQQINSRKNKIDSSLTRIAAFYQDDPKQYSKLSELKSLLEDYRRMRQQQYDFILKGRVEEAKQLGFGAQMERYEKIRLIAVELGNEAKKRAKVETQKSEETTTNAMNVFILIGIAILLFGIIVTFFLNRIIANPLKEITNIAEQIAGGDLNVSVALSQRGDEVGALSRSFGKMVQSLKAIAEVAQQIAIGNLAVSVKSQSEKDILGNAFTKMIENLRRITKEILDAVNILASSASEILAATTQMASGANETASSISETTTTVEEVKQTAQVSTQKAKYVSESSQRASSISQTGKKSVEETINMMNKIREQMESVAGSIVRLSEQSQAISEIITTVNDLADQSNLLAVNAAIEASKAGEHGKGFTVVAQEVRMLAEQSKQATVQVRKILSDVQKAMSSAVMATEQGTKAVEAGVKQTSEAGESIFVLSENISEAAQAATHIAASSQQQSVGMDQVAIAMESIKLASMQNVASTQQAETAARNLHVLGTKLKELIEHYKM